MRVFSSCFQIKHQLFQKFIIYYLINEEKYISSDIIITLNIHSLILQFSNIN